MLRAARFSAKLDLEPTPELVAAVRSTRPRLNIVSKERIAAELTKLLKLPRPSAGFAFLEHTGLLSDLLAPWSAELDGAGSAARMEVLTAALDTADADLGVRWAVLLGPVCPTPDHAAVGLATLRIDKHTISRVTAILRTVAALDAALEDAGPRIPEAIGTPTRRSARRRDRGCRQHAQRVGSASVAGDGCSSARDRDD